MTRVARGVDALELRVESRRVARLRERRELRRFALQRLRVGVVTRPGSVPAGKNAASPSLTPRIASACAASCARELTCFFTTSDIADMCAPIDFITLWRYFTSAD